MFTGLIREFGKVERFENSLLTVACKHKAALGDSIAINGACLTVVALHDGGFSVELSSESSGLLAIENYKNLVHIEPAMRLMDRVDGHLMQGHVDSVGTISKISIDKVGVDFFIDIDADAMKFMIPKGSVAIDGVSLTINEVLDGKIRLTIIPHTFDQTLFREYKVGRRVNVESDMIVRSLYHMIHKEKKVSWEDIDRISSLYG